VEIRSSGRRSLAERRVILNIGLPVYEYLVSQQEFIVYFASNLTETERKSMIGSCTVRFIMLRMVGSRKATA
jgi:hypothetical protein